MNTGDMLAQQPCRWCGLIHGVKCPSVKAIEYQDDGVTVKRVEFMTPADYATPAPSPGFYGPATCSSKLRPGRSFLPTYP